MKASTFPREYKAYDIENNVMIEPKELLSRGFSVTPDGLPSNQKEILMNIVLLWYSGQLDSKGNKIFEGDICKVQVKNEFGSLSTDYGIMRWVPQNSVFILQIPSVKGDGGRMLEVTQVEKIGHELTNPELLPLITVTPEDNGQKA